MMKKPKTYAISCFIITGFVITIAFLNGAAISSGTDRYEENARVTDTQHSEKSVIHLYFSDKKNSFLKAETRNFFHSDDTEEFGKNIIETLIEGPRTGLMRTIPGDTTIKAFYITRDGVAYVDLSDAVKDAHPGGVKSELFTIYSIVNSLTLNIPEISAVKILINGKEAMTLGGHIDTRLPIKANMLLIR